MRMARMLVLSGLLIATVIVFTAGCRNPWVAMEFDLLHHEMRQMEDYIYHLEHELERKCEELAGCRTSNARTTMEADDLTTSDSQDDLDNVELPIPSVTLGPEEQEEPEFLQRPPDEEPTSLEIPDIEGPKNVDELPGANLPIESHTKTADHTVIDTEITHIVLNQRLTGGHDSDGVPGDDGITVVVEPRNVDGQFVPLAGTMVLVLLDPQKKDEEACVARWDIDRVKVGRSLYVVGPDPGIHLEVPWSGTEPGHSRLHLFARYETVDGRFLETDQKITIARTGEISTRWIPSTRFSRQQRRLATKDQGLVDDHLSRRVTDKTPEVERENDSAPSEVIADIAPVRRPPSTARPLSVASPHHEDRLTRGVPKPPEWRPYR